MIVCCLYISRLLEVRSRIYELITHCIPPVIIMKVHTSLGVLCCLVLLFV